MAQSFVLCIHAAEFYHRKGKYLLQDFADTAFTFEAWIQTSSDCNGGDTLFFEAVNRLVVVLLVDQLFITADPLSRVRTL